MAWTYLVESAESDRPWRPGSEHGPFVKTTDSAPPSYFQEWPAVKSTELPFGMMLPLLVQMESHQSTLYLVASLARISALREMGLAWERGREAGFSAKSSDWLAKYDPASCSWKMSQLSLFEAAGTLLERLPNWGMSADGSLWQLPKSAPPTAEIDGGVWLTPKNQETDETAEAFSTRMGDRSLNCFGSLTAQAKAWASKWGTPRKSDSNGTGALGSKSFNHNVDRGYLVAQALLWSDHRNQRTFQGGKNILKETPRLNPRFVEALLGYKAGVTELEPWAIAWIGQRRGKRSKS